MHEIIFKNGKLKTFDSLVNANLRDADLSNADLREVNLIKVNLSYADLKGANLRAADLSCADLSYADLSSADLSYADLKGANLTRTELHGANLKKSELSYVIGNKKEIKTMLLDTWDIVFTKDTIAIGCQQHSIECWRNFTDDEINKMEKGALNWWKKWKDFIFMAIELSFGNDND